MKTETKNQLIKYNKSKKWGTTDAGLMETIIEAKPIWEGKRDRHRWYTLIPRVVVIDGMYLQFSYCDVDGEQSSVEDCIGGYKLKDVIEVGPKTVETVIYEPI